MNFTELRLKIGTQKEFAKVVDSKQSTVAMWECGKNYPRRATLKKISTLLSVSIDDILEAIDNSKKIG